MRTFFYLIRTIGVMIGLTHRPSLKTYWLANDASDKKAKNEYYFDR